jgi:predicted secreted protein
MPTVTPHKLQGYKAQLGYMPTAGGAVQIVAGLKEVEGAFKADELDTTDHGSGGWKSRMLGLLDFEGTAKLDFIMGDNTQQVLRDSLLNRTALPITLFPEQASGEDSYTGSVVITDFKWDGKNNDAQGVSISMKAAGAFAVTAQTP